MNNPGIATQLIDLLMTLFRPLDLIIVILVLVFGTAAVFRFQGGKGARAEVYVDNRKAAVFSLEGPETVKAIRTRIGRVELRVGNGTIRVVRSPCKQKICILQGEIAHTHERIICVPARMVIRVVEPENADSSEQPIDAVSY